jgi:hypothetical protein
MTEQTRTALPRVIQLRNQNYGWPQIARTLNKEGYQTARGKRWTRSIVTTMFLRHGKEKPATSNGVTAVQAKSTIPSVVADIHQILSLSPSIINEAGMIVLIRERLKRENN